MDPRLYSVVDGGSGIYRGGVQSASDGGVDLAAAFYADSSALPPCHQLRASRSHASVVDVLEPPPNPVSRDFVARAFYDGGGGGRAVSSGPGSFWDRRRAPAFLPDSMAPGVIGGYDDSTAGLVQGNTRPCRSDIIGGKDTPCCGASSVSSASITSSSMTSSSSLSRKKKPIGTMNDTAQSTPPPPSLFPTSFFDSTAVHAAKSAGFQNLRVPGSIGPYWIALYSLTFSLFDFDLNLISRLE